MSIWKRRGRVRETPPADVLALFDEDERVVSWADTATGHVVVATPLGLWWPTADGYRRIRWQFISKATWNSGVLTVTESDLVDDLLLFDRTAVKVALAKPRDLPPTIRKRVEGNIVYNEQVAIGGGTARLLARKTPGGDGLRWWAKLDGAEDTAEVRAAITARLTRLRTDPGSRTLGG